LSYYDKEICTFIIKFDPNYTKYIPQEYIHLAFNDDFQQTTADTTKINKKNELDKLIDEFNSYEGLTSPEIIKPEINESSDDFEKNTDDDDNQDKINQSTFELDNTRQRTNSNYCDPDNIPLLLNENTTTKEQTDGWFNSWFRG